MRDPFESKRHYRIGEVAKLLGVKPHVLRYWETEFPELRPLKTRGNHRHYRREDVELASQIKVLVHERGFTLAGARRHLRALRGERQPVAEPSAELALREELLAMKRALEGVLDDLDDIGRRREETPAWSVVIEHVVPKSRRR